MIFLRFDPSRKRHSHQALLRTRAFVASFLLSVTLVSLLVRVSVAEEPKMRAHFIDVGQGASTLLEFPCGAILIDTGAQDKDHVEQLISYLDTFFARRSDLHETLAEVIVTHPHIDHSMGLRRVAEKYKILNYVDDGETRGSGKANPIWIREQVRAGTLATKIRTVSDDEILHLPHKHGLTDSSIDPLKCDDCDPKIVILSGGMEENPGWSSRDFQNLNNHSIVTRVDFGQSSFLFPGDLETPAIQTLVDYYHNTEMLDVDVYQVGHHGSYNGTTQAFVEAMSPKAAVISCGDWDFGSDRPGGFTTFNYGHPRLSTIQLLEDGIHAFRKPAIEAGAFLKSRQPGWIDVQKNIYCTGWDGNVTIEADLYGVMTTHVEKHKTPPPQRLEIPAPEPPDYDDAP